MPQKGEAIYSDPGRSGQASVFKRTISLAGESVLKYQDKAALAWLLSSVFWLIVVTSLGFTMANELIMPNLFEGVPWIIFPRIRPMHVNGVILAWLSSMYWGAIFYVLPRLLGRSKLWGERLGIWTSVSWDIFFALALVTLGNGYTQGREYWELIWPLDVWMLITWIANTVIVIMSVIERRVKPLYVTVWWCMAAPLWLGATWFITNVMWRPGNMLGNGVPGAALSGAFINPLHDVMLNWWGSHNLFGLWLTPGLILVVYYMVPRITGTPLYSHTLSLISFLGGCLLLRGRGSPPPAPGAHSRLAAHGCHH